MKPRPATMKRFNHCILTGVCATVLVLFALQPLPAMGADSDDELAKATLNPVAALISVPIQNVTHTMCNRLSRLPSAVS
jgi:hypothetical protein